MKSPETIAVLMLGGAFDANELGDNDIALVPDVVERLQAERVTGFDEVHVELIDRADFDRISAENEALQQRLNAADEEIDRLRNQPAKQRQGEPVAWVRFRNGEPDYDGDACMIMNVPGDTLGDGDSWEPLYTHADPGEVERLRADRDSLRETFDNLIEKLGIIRSEAQKEPGKPSDVFAKHVNILRAKLAERNAMLRKCLMAVREQHCAEDEAEFDLPVPLMAEIDAALSASAEPSAPVEIDDISDKQRLDSIEKFGFSISATKFVGGFCGPRGREWRAFKYGCGFEVEGETLREALDKARAALERKQ